MDGHVECKEETGNAHGMMVTRRGGKRQAGESKHRKEDNIKMNCKEPGWSTLDWIKIERVSRSLTTPQSPSHLYIANRTCGETLTATATRGRSYAVADFSSHIV
jgi:hypothetical protein